MKPQRFAPFFPARANRFLRHCMIAGLICAARPALADFSGHYDALNWTFSTNGGNGFTINDGATLSLAGNDNGCCLDHNSDYTITALASGTWNFNWSYSSVDCCQYDSGGYLHNGTYTLLAYNENSGVSGSISIEVAAGDAIGFRVQSADSCCGTGVLTIQDFSVVEPVRYNEEFENDDGGFTFTGLWHHADKSICGGESGFGLYYGYDAFCDFNTGAANSGTATSPPLALPSGSSISLSFRYRLATEDFCNFDLAELRVSGNGGPYSTVASNCLAPGGLDDPSNGWASATVDLSAYTGQVINLQFAFDTGDHINNGFLGLIVDDIAIISIAGNDHCSNALGITGPSTFFSTNNTDTDGPDGCFWMFINDVWFDYTATANEHVEFNTFGSQFDTVLEVYDGCACPVATMLACSQNDLADFNFGSRVVVPVQLGHCYKIRVGGCCGIPSGPGVLNVITGVSPDPSPANDLCANATVVAPGTTPFTNSQAMTDGPAACNKYDNDAIDLDVWFKYTATDCGTVQIDTCAGGHPDVELAVYEGCACPASDADMLACNDQACGNDASVTVPVLAGACYLIRIGGWQGAEGDGILTITPLPDACPTPGPITQDRHVSAQAGVSGYPSDSETISATDFGPFVATASASGGIPPGGPNPPGPPNTASASQNSTMSGLSMVGSGSSSFFAPSFGSASGESHFEVTFFVDEPTIMNLSGSLTASNDFATGTSDASVFLTGPGVSFSQVASSPLQPPFTVTVPFQYSHLYEVGVYTLVVQAISDQPLVPNGQASAGFQFELEPAVPGDLNGDGHVNVIDLLALIGAWGSCPATPQPCPADFNGDGIVNVADLLLLIGNWG